MVALVRHNAPIAPPRPDDLNLELGGDVREIERLYIALDRVDDCRHPRTARLLAAGRRKMAQKLMEEAAEVALEAAQHRTRAVIRESADLVYHLVVLWRECGIAPGEVWAEMRHRADTLGIAEKLPKPDLPVSHAPNCGRGGAR
jgi:phosphoribosyl-ATP pyrophosphohydrolase